VVRFVRTGEREQVEIATPSEEGSGGSRVDLQACLPKHVLRGRQRVPVQVQVANVLQEQINQGVALLGRPLMPGAGLADGALHHVATGQSSTGKRPPKSLGPCVVEAEDFHQIDKLVTEKNLTRSLIEHRGDRRVRIGRPAPRGVAGVEIRFFASLPYAPGFHNARTWARSSIDSRAPLALRLHGHQLVRAFEQHAEADGLRLADAERVAGSKRQAAATVAGSRPGSQAPVLVAIAADGLMSRRTRPSASRSSLFRCGASNERQQIWAPDHLSAGTSASTGRGRVGTRSQANTTISYWSEP
jgi:hypothetical protein